MKRSRGEKIFGVVNIIIMLCICIITLYPYLNQIAISLNDGADSMRGGITIFPRKFTLENYRGVLFNDAFLQALLISVSRVILVTFLGLSVTFSAAYGLTRRGLPYRKTLTLILMIPSYISAGVIPGYILFRTLHIINTYWIYLIPGLFSFYNMIIMRSFLQEIPQSLEESAKVDGANDIIIMIRIIMPLCMPVIATVALWISVGAWNDWTTTLMYITDKKLYTLQYLMMRLIKESETAKEMAVQIAMNRGSDMDVAKTTSESVTAATLIITTLPIICVYPFLQKYFISGVTLGAVKE